MYLQSFLAGIAGTAFMTLGMYVLAGITSDHFKVVKVLGTMLTSQTTDDGGLSDTTSAIIVGIIAHYLVGIGFSFVYTWLWQKEIIAMTFPAATAMGFLNGIIGAAVWRIFFAVHSRPPEMPLPKYLLAITLGHFLFAHGIYATHLIFKEGITT
jgi:hypothetical protein